MNKLKNSLLYVCLGISLVVNAQAQEQDDSASAFMTGRDIQANATSNISITNGAGQSVSVSGLFIPSFDATTVEEGDCSVCTGGIVGGDNMGGTIVSPVIIGANKAAAIGQNYLYNMIYNGIYYIRNTVGSSPCQLPGCSWPGDSTDRRWCLSINATSLNASYTYSHYVRAPNPPAAAPAYGAAGSSVPIQFDYNYDLINPNTLGVANACLGPVTCNDQTLTCTVATPQSETFQPWS